MLLPAWQQVDPPSVSAPANPANDVQEDKKDDESFWDLLTDPEDQAFDVSRFLATRTGFLPIVLPITEPAVGYGAAAGLMFFHGNPTVKETKPGEPARIILPSITGVFGMATENGSWAAGFGHVGMWDEGRIRYAGGAGYAALNLDWFGRGESLPHSVDYTIRGLGVLQQLNFQLGESDFFAGLRQRFIGTNTHFDLPGSEQDILPDELTSKTSGLGLGATYDTRDNPFCPRHGIYADITWVAYSEWIGGDFDYDRFELTLIDYVPIGDEWAIGLRYAGQFSGGDVPFYDLARINLRGVSADQFMDRNSMLVESELRWDFFERWSAVAFGGVGRVASAMSTFDDADNIWSGGGGIRYLIARKMGLRMGIDIARGPDTTALYVTVGTGWFRP